MQQIDDYLAEAEAIRVRRHLEPRLRRELDALTEAFRALLGIVYQIDDAAADYLVASGEVRPSNSNHAGLDARIQQPEHARGLKGVRVARDTDLDAYLKQDMRRRVQSLTRSLGYIHEEAVQALRGNIRRRNRLRPAQVRDIKARRQESTRTLAAEHAVDESTVRRIKRGDTWKGDEPA